MEQKNVTTVARQFKRTFSEEDVNGLGKAVGFCQRERDITPHRLALGLMEVFAGARVETIADAHRAFNALCEAKVHYKPFHNQLAKPTFPAFMRTLYERLMGELTTEVLRFRPESPFARLAHITVHDGTSYALKHTLKRVFPGRFRTVSPAAVELHVTLDLLSEGTETVVLTPDSESEVHHAPSPQSLSGGLLLADRMFFVKDYLAAIAAAGGYFLIKAKDTLNPRVVAAYSAQGVEVRAFRFLNQPLNDLKPCIRQYQALDLDVAWGDFQARLVVTWDKKNKTARYLLTNLPRAEFSLEAVCDAYRLRWQVELLFKEWKSYASLHAFDTSNPHIAEGLLWAALCAATLKRYCAHMAQRLWRVPISTRKVAMCLRHVLTDIFRALMHTPRVLNQALRRALHYLSENAQRAHPLRDQLRGRLKLGLEHVYGIA